MVWAEERKKPGSKLSLRRRDPEKGNWTLKSLGHTDKGRARQAAEELAEALSGQCAHEAAGTLTLARLFALYEDAESKHKKGKGLTEDQRRMDLWQAYLGHDFVVTDLKPSLLKTFIRERKAGGIVVEGRNLAKEVSDTAAGADIKFLKITLNWAAREELIADNPIRHFPIPKNRNPKRPVVTYDRFLQLRPHCRDSSDRLWTWSKPLGWRVGAIRQLQACDVRRVSETNAPFGWILKRGETDKRGVEMWVPMREEVRRAIDEVFQMRKVAGKVYLFSSGRAGNKPWRDRAVWSMLRRTEKAAGLEKIERGAFHPYRRKYRRERNHLPDATWRRPAGGWMCGRWRSMTDRTRRRCGRS